MLKLFPRWKTISAANCEDEKNSFWIYIEKNRFGDERAFIMSETRRGKVDIGFAKRYIEKFGFVIEQ